MGCKVSCVLDLLDEEFKRLVWIVGLVHVSIIGFQIGWSDIGVGLIQVVQ